ncbi:MAG: 7-cyano-7-deazaguanine synthase [Candidatus Omnitrophica bacterium]|nr:7-cyano-7-deazaguanine synthase [Candidatus Omnitrophota bacterium]
MPGTETMTMKIKAVALLSGGLDSMLAIAIVKEQGIEIEAVNFQTIFGCCKDDARQAAHMLGVSFTLLSVQDDYLNMVEKPKYGYGKGINPCVDCRIYMFRTAKKFMEQTGASFLISGEVLDQRPMSQKKRDFEIIEADAGLKGRILRPLSAKLLAPTEMEKEGVVDRERLYAIHGRSRSELLRLAQKYGIENPPMPSAGCALTSPAFGKKVRDVFRHHPGYSRWEFEILKIGRHFRLDRQTKVVISRNHDQNNYLEALHPEGTALLISKNFGGPHALLIGNNSEENRRKAVSAMLRYSQKPLPEICEIVVKGPGGNETVLYFSPAGEIPEAELESLRIV